MFEMVIMILATWRISMLLVYDDIFCRLRERVGVGMTKENGSPINIWSWILSCFWCCSLVIAALMHLLSPCVSVLVMSMRPFAVSGGAILMHYMARMHLQLLED